MQSQLLRVDEAAKRLGLSPFTVRKWMSDGKLPTVRLSKGAVRVREQDVEAIIAANLSAPTRTIE